MGGMVAAIDQGYPQQEIEYAAFSHQKAVEEGERVVVGVNAYQYSEEGDSTSPKNLVSKEIEKERKEQLFKYREERDVLKLYEALQIFDKAASEGRNIMPSIINALELKATLGELSDVLRTRYGLHKP